MCSSRPLFDRRLVWALLCVGLAACGSKTRTLSFADGTPYREYGWDAGRRHGHWFQWYESGVLFEEARFVDGVLDGPFGRYYPDGGPEERGRYRGGLRVGIWERWHPGGQPMSRGECVDGDRNGTWLNWRADGSPESEVLWEMGTRVQVTGL